jgi:MFS-type transporter involved in bile tolerance (Atg22 family)
LLARVDASVRTLGYGATLVGALVSGVLAEQFGARSMLFTSSALVAVAALAAWLGFRLIDSREVNRQQSLG